MNRNECGRIHVHDIWGMVCCHLLQTCDLRVADLSMCPVRGIPASRVPDYSSELRSASTAIAGVDSVLAWFRFGSFIQCTYIAMNQLWGRGSIVFNFYTVRQTLPSLCPFNLPFMLWYYSFRSYRQTLNTRLTLSPLCPQSNRHSVHPRWRPRALITMLTISTPVAHLGMGAHPIMDGRSIFQGRHRSGCTLLARALSAVRRSRRV